MRLTTLSAVLAVTAYATAGCSNSTSPSSTPGTTMMTFSAVANGAPISNYSESNFTLSANPGDWVGVTTYGNPSPFIEFFAAPTSPAAPATVVGQVTVFAIGHAPFRFQSVDLYSSVTKIPYELTGFRNDAAIYIVSDTLPNTFGNFRTVVNTHPADVIDTLVIKLTNSTPTRNPMGLDNLVLLR